MTPLLLSAGYANVAATKLLLSKGANVNAVTAHPRIVSAGDPKSGPVALHNFTPLLMAMPLASREVVQTLLEAGADVNAKDSRNMTPLMLAVATNHQNPGVIRMLLDHGANVEVQSNAGETAADWARKVGAPAGLQLLKVARTAETAITRPRPRAVDVKAATERSMALLESSSQKFFETSGCVSCHHQNIADFAAAEMRTKGLRFDPKAAVERVKMLASGPPPALLYERMDIGVPEIFASSLAALPARAIPPIQRPTLLVADIAASQMADGSWYLVGGIRKPTSRRRTAFITRTALCVRSLKVFGAAGTRGRDERAHSQGPRWLQAAKPSHQRSATCACWASIGRAPTPRR